jgi:hypothetical protein
MSNKRRIQPEEEAPKVATDSTPSKSPKENPAQKFLSAINVFDYLDKKSLINVIPFIAFLTGIAMLYIANSYCAEKTIRDINTTQKELKELRSEFITGKSELMCKSKLSEVAKEIEPLGIKESTMAPKKILVHAKTKSTE